jgi:hypothetical protein
MSSNKKPAKVQDYILGDVDIEKMKGDDEETYLEFMESESRRWLD